MRKGCGGWSGSLRGLRPQRSCVRSVLLKRTIPDPDPEALKRVSLSERTPPEPFRIEPMFMPRIWGSRSLAPLFPDKTNLAEPIGEAWLTGVDCRVATGPFAGKTLGEAWREMPAEWRGEKFKEPGDFPLLVKFIFPQDKLSIQVHPDDAYAALHEKAAGGRGKTEMWHAVSAEPGAQVLIGLKPGVDKQKFLAALEAQTLEELFVAHPVQAGDTFFLPAGTPHTIGPGMVLCEVQQYSDLTYRVYDYGRVDAQGRQRELHVEKALAVMNFGSSPTGAFRPDNYMDEFGTAYVYYLAACRYFAAEKIFPDSANLVAGAGKFELIVVLHGKGHILWNLGEGRLTGERRYKKGQVWFIPASLSKYMVFDSREGSEVLRVYVPEIVEFDQKMRERGYDEKWRRRFIFL